jgi:hypothetical protein
MRRRGDLAAVTDDGDDDPAAARGHALDHRIDDVDVDVDVGEELGVECRAPGRRGRFVRRRSSGGASGIDQDVDRADAAFDRVDHRARRRGVAEVGGEGARPSEADTFRPAGDQNDLAFETEFHRPHLIPGASSGMPSSDSS